MHSPQPVWCQWYGVPQHVVARRSRRRSADSALPGSPYGEPGREPDTASSPVGYLSAVSVPAAPQLSVGTSWIQT
ncbi:hypothetical protein GCM10023075_62170 [Streptosporangium album]